MQTKPYLDLTFRFIDRNYEEIINERDFGFESLWSTVGGFVGIFVGTSLSQVPSFIAFVINRIQNIIKQ